MIAVPMEVSVLSPTVAIEVECINPEITVEIGAEYQINPPYDGPYEIAPSQEYQIVSVTGKYMKHDIVVDPIPSNYGLITWNGACLTVS